MVGWSIPALAASGAPAAGPQATAKTGDTAGAELAPPALIRLQDLRNWYGLQVHDIQFQGVLAEDIPGLRSKLALQAGDQLSEEKIKESLHRLYTTGLYRNLLAEGVQSGGQVTVVFRGVPQLFLRRLVVRGMKQELLAAQLQRATRLDIGVPFTESDLNDATANMKASLARHGYFQPTVTVKTVAAGPQHLVDVIYTVETGKQAVVGTLTVTGSPGMTVPAFRRIAKLKERSKVTPNTVPRALHRLRNYYQKQDRLEASVRADGQKYQPAFTQVDYGFDVTRGPAVRVVVSGAKISKRDVKRLVPVYEEGAVDPDLLDEGNDNLRNHFQKQGYFDARVTHTVAQPQPSEEVITYHVVPGTVHKVVAVHVTGNRYFSTALIKERLTVHRADTLNPHGLFSQSMLQNDIDTVTALYKSNGFGNVAITPLIVDSDRTKALSGRKLAVVSVTYQIDEGVQQKIGKIELIGAKQLSPATLRAQMSTRSGEPYSLATLAADRVQLFDTYYRRGFSQVELTFEQRPEKDDPNLIDIVVRIHEGNPFYVNRVLISGLHYTRPSVVNKLLEIKPGDPLNRNAILDTQRRLYNLALFNEVDTGIVNPNGNQPRKDVLLNLTEADRWTYDYGFGIEAQTGTPQKNCPSAASLIELGVNPNTYQCSPNGKFGVSPRISFDLSRINLRGKNQSLTLQTAYGTLEQQAILTFAIPKFYGHKTIDFAVSGGYVSNQDVTTYEASSISGSIQFTHRPNKANTLIYSMSYRYVYVNPNSLQVSAELIPLLSQPTRVSGPGFTWVHDTRNNPLNATSGWYVSAQEFFAWSGLASQANFNRIDTQESNYYPLGHKWILARSTRIGLENTYGDPTYNLIPLPERLYAGGATSHRGFSVNAAGPRDLQTGYPVGGSAAFVNSTELRIPPVPLPLIGQNLGFAIFDDLGNVFQNPSDMFPSLLRFHQPDITTCYDLKGPEGTCNFNYDAQAVGLGLRYKTPVGPIRLDFAYNINPTVYPVVSDPSLAPANLDYNDEPPYVGNSGHFNFFFSIGQAF